MLWEEHFDCTINQNVTKNVEKGVPKCDKTRSNKTCTVCQTVSLKHISFPKGRYIFFETCVLFHQFVWEQKHDYGARKIPNRNQKTPNRNAKETNNEDTQDGSSWTPNSKSPTEETCSFWLRVPKREKKKGKLQKGPPMDLQNTQNRRQSYPKDPTWTTKNLKIDAKNTHRRETKALRRSPAALCPAIFIKTNI